MWSRKREEKLFPSFSLHFDNSTDMSKNTGATKFRKVDVDQYDPDKYSEDVTEGEESNEGPNESTINNFLAQYPF